MIAFGIIWFFVTLSVESSVIPISDVIFEHRLYLAIVGVSLCFPVMLDYAARLLRPRVPLRVVPAGLLAEALGGRDVGLDKRADLSQGSGHQRRASTKKSQSLGSPERVPSAASAWTRQR